MGIDCRLANKLPLKVWERTLSETNKFFKFKE